jgi:cysteine desulfurase family protein (TIGR01976 family)
MLNIESVRAQFPALSHSESDRCPIFLDNPAGTQVPQQVLDRMNHYLVHDNANLGGAFRASQASDALLMEAREAMACLLNAPSPREIVFGPNMTSLTFALSRAMESQVKSGDEIIVTRLDHDANISPWMRLAEDRGARIKWLDFDPQDCTLNLAQLETLLTDRTILLALGYASNLVGTVNPVAEMARMAHQTNALVFVDAVHQAPHGPVDVQALDADFLVCSPYKFFGPHQGVLWGKYDLLEALPAYRVRPAPLDPPGKFETGTQNHEGIAGILGAVDYLRWLGKSLTTQAPSLNPGQDDLVQSLNSAMSAIREYELQLCHHLIHGLQSVPGLTIHGITDPAQFVNRVPTVSFTMDQVTPQQIARKLAAHDIRVWDGHSYALEVVARLGLTDKGGVVRVGPVHYNTLEELDTLFHCLRTISG